MAARRRPRLKSLSSLPLATVAVFVLSPVSPAAAQAVAPDQLSFGRDTTCIAIVLPGVEGVDGSATQVADAARELFGAYLTGPSLKAVSLDARLVSQAVEEARQKNCDQILVTKVTRKRGGVGLGRALGQAAGTAAWYVPGVSGAAGAVTRGVVIAGAQAVSSLAQTTRAKDELQLDYRISALEDVASAKLETLKAKASANGEDLLTPLVEKASEAIATRLARK